MSLAPTPIAQPAIMVTNAHSARPLSFFARQTQITTPAATTYTHTGWLTSCTASSTGTSPCLME